MRSPEETERAIAEVREAFSLATEIGDTMSSTNLGALIMGLQWVLGDEREIGLAGLLRYLAETKRSRTRVRTAHSN